MAEKLLSPEELKKKAKEAIEVLGGLMKDVAGPSSSSCPPTSEPSEELDSKSKSGKHTYSFYLLHFQYDINSK